ncbi:MAG: iron ABC transporter permease [Kiritimatiellae bacterium]|nr:iron ABC transporter permease [Kiritimatiellia bacterium]
MSGIGQAGGAPLTWRSWWGLWVGGLAVAAAAFWLATRLGPLPLGSGSPWADPVWRLRAARAVAAGIVGGGLGIAGAAMQGLLRNPLGEPYLLGMSSGAGVGVRLGGLLGWGAGWLAWRTPLLALAGALAAGAIVYAVAWRGGWRDPWSLVLAGVMMNVVNGAVIMALYLWSDPWKLDEFARWTMGEVPETVEPVLLVAAGGMLALGTVVLCGQAAPLNAIAMGDETAMSVGVSVEAVRRAAAVAAGVTTAAAVSLAGPVSFVGLLVPHLGRWAVGPDHRRLLPWSLWGGAVWMMLADAFCRWLGARLGVGRLPVGLMMALIGAPLFFAVLRSAIRTEADGG